MSNLCLVRPLTEILLTGELVGVVTVINQDIKPHYLCVCTKMESKDACKMESPKQRKAGCKPLFIQDGVIWSRSIRPQLKSTQNIRK